MIAVRCECGVQLMLEDQWAGKQGKCPQCGCVLQIPVAGPSSEAGLAAKVPVEPLKTKLDDQAAIATAAAAVSQPAPPSPSAARPKPASPPPPPRPSSSAAVGPQFDAPAGANQSPPVQHARPAQPRRSHKPLFRDLFGNLDARQQKYLLAAVGGGAALLLLVLLIAAALFSGPDEVVEAPIDERAVPAPRERPDRSRSGPTNPPPANIRDVDTQPVDTPDPHANGGIDMEVNGGTDTEAVAASADGFEDPYDAAPPLANDVKPPAEIGRLEGGSPQYDDPHCRRIQFQHAIRIPPSATILEVNGVLLPIDNVEQLPGSPAPYLFLPKGNHFVRFRPDELWVEIKIGGHLRDVYDDMRRFFDVPGAVRQPELVQRSARAFDAHRQPFLLNLLGAAYAAKGEQPAAERKFRRALRVNPTFSPAHLNLAHMLHQRGATQQAIHQIGLAEAFNVGDVFGLSMAIAQLRREWKVPTSPGRQIRFSAADYLPAHQLSVDDQRMTALMEALAKYAVMEEDRGKILNNLGVHFLDSNKPEWALLKFRAAMLQLRDAGASRFAIGRKVLANMKTACRDAGFTELDEYDKIYEWFGP